MGGKHLKEESYYWDLYDRMTVEDCRRAERMFSEDEKAEEDEYSKLEKGMQNMVKEIYLHISKGENYAKKSDTIRKWMDRDRERDHLFETAQAPQNILCLTCSRLMFVESKHLDFGGLEEMDRVLFFFACPLKHLPMRAFYHNGEEWKRKHSLCPNCHIELNEKSVRKENIITTTETCSRCGHEAVNEIDLTSKPQEEKIDSDFAKDRERFCLSDKEGGEYIQSRESLKRVTEMMEKDKEKERNKELYEKVAKLKKLKIVELEQLLTPILEKAQYTKLHFKDPEISKDVFLPFVVYDAKEGREERASSYEIEVLLRKTLKDTNWRLMTDGVRYRLGMLEGRLHGYEREEDLLKLVQSGKVKENEKRI